MCTKKVSSGIKCDTVSPNFFSLPGQEFEVRTGEEIWSVDLTQVSQCVLPGTNRNELELQFPESDTIEAGTDQLGTAFKHGSITAHQFYPT